MRSSAKDKKDLIISETLRPNKGYLPLSRLRLLKHQTQWPATCLVATQQDHKLIFQKNCTWTQAWFRSFLPDSWINAASAREVKQMAWDEPRGCCRRCLQKFQPHAVGNELEILFQHLQRRRHPPKILLTPQDRPWTADCGLFQECTKAPAWRRWHEWAQCKVADSSMKVQSKDRRPYHFTNLTAKQRIFALITPASAETPGTVTSHLPGCNAARS